MQHYTKSLPYELSLTSRVFQEAAAKFFKQNKFPVTMDEFIILDCLFIYPDIIQIQLAKLILKGRSHTGKLLKSLEEKNLILRTPIMQGSKLVIKLEITKSGKKLYKQLNTAIDNYVSNLESEMNVKINEVIQMLQEIRGSVVKRFDINFE